MENPGAEWYEHDLRYSFRNLNPLVTDPEHNHREFLKDAPNKGGKLLDVGTGTGYFLAAADKLDYDSYGIDFDQEAIITARDIFKLKNAYVGDVDYAIEKFGEHYFDVLTLFEVMEHLDKPKEFLVKARQLLKSGGHIAISVPFRGSWNVFKKFDKPPRHLTRWNQKSMKNFLESNGFKVVRTKVISAPFSFIIGRFHFWFKGIFSFGIVEKVAAKSKDASGRLVDNSKINTLRKLALAKDYILFTIPAAFLYVYLWLVRKNGIDLYVLAKLGDID